MQRNYNQEMNDDQNKINEKYTYNFDLDVMHPLMFRSFQPFFRAGNLLELGSARGIFTNAFLDYFDEITCVEASEQALLEAKNRLGARVNFVNSMFENAELSGKFNNVIMTHVLEHLDDPVGVLKRIRSKWLSDAGRLFLVCPNANAASRQIAVHMGLISHNAAVTDAENEHGHRITYSSDTLEREVRLAGLKVIHRSGIFFKALANFQWDMLLNTNIVNKEYLEGCYQLGLKYPDLCSSILLICESGDDLQ